MELKKQIQFVYIKLNKKKIAFSSRFVLLDGDIGWSEVRKKNNKSKFHFHNFFLSMLFFFIFGLFMKKMMTCTRTVVYLHVYERNFSLQLKNYTHI